VLEFRFLGFSIFGLTIQDLGFYGSRFRVSSLWFHDVLFMFLGFGMWGFRIYDVAF